MTLGELEGKGARALVGKEARLGLMNGALVGLMAGGGMFVTATMQQTPNPIALSLIVMIAMMGSCMVSGISGAGIPLILGKLGFDPATARASS